MSRPDEEAGMSPSQWLADSEVSTTNSASPSRTVTEARTIARRLAETQVSPHSFAADAATMAELDVLQDPDLRYEVLRVFSSATAALASELATEITGRRAGDVHEEFVVKLIGRAIDGVVLDPRSL